MAIKNKKLMKRTFLTGSALAALLSAGILIGCSGDIGIADAQGLRRRRKGKPGDFRAGAAVSTAAASPAASMAAAQAARPAVKRPAGPTWRPMTPSTRFAAAPGSS